METGTVTAAAERLYITQPAVTRLVRDLEQAIDFALFQREKGRLRPTVEAQLLYEEVERSFTGLDKILQSASDIRALRTGTLRIAALPAMALGFLPRVIRRFSQQHSNVSISLQIRSSTKVLEWVASQQFDLGFAAGQQSHPAVAQELLLEAPFVAIMPRSHPLSSKQVLEPKDFEGQDFISLGPEVNVRGRIDEAFAAAKVNRRQLIDSQLSAAVCRLVAEGGGLSLIEPITAAEFMDQGIVVRPFRPRLTYQYSLLFPLHRSRSAIAGKLVELVKSELARNPLLT